MTSIFLYEHLCATAADPSLPPSWRAEGRAMRDALVTDFGRLADVELRIAESDGEAAFRAAARADWSLIIAPETGGILERLVRWVEEEGGRLLGPAAEAVRLCADKLRFAEALPASIPHPEIVRDGGAWPQVWKPRDGAGSQDTHLVRNAGEAGSLIGAGFGHLLRTEYVPGIAASVGFLCGPARVVALAPCRQRLSADGRFRYLGGSLPIGPELAARAEAAARPAVEWLHRNAPFCGYVGTDVILGERRDVLVEINPRMTTSYIGLRRLAVGNLAGAMLAIAGGGRGNLEWRSGHLEFDAYFGLGADDTWRPSRSGTDV